MTVRPALFLAAAWLGLLAGCRAAEAPLEPFPDPPIAMEPVLDEPFAGDPYQGIFPPVWKAGDHWRVATRSNDSLPARGPSPFFETRKVYDVSVTAAPTADGLQRLDIVAAGKAQHVIAVYRRNPFSFVRLEDARGRPLRGPRDENPSPAPWFGFLDQGFLDDFPVQPRAPTLGIESFTARGLPATQQVQRTRSGLRFTLRRGQRAIVMDWKRGDPWWSTLRDDAVPWPGDDGYAVFLASGRLLPR